MNSLLPEISATADFGLNWPTWIAAGGFALFCLLGLYASLMLAAGKYLRQRFQFLQFPTLRGRLLAGFILVATLPAISLALVLSERTTNERLAHTETILKSQAFSIANLSDFFLQRLTASLTESARQFDPGIGHSGIAQGDRLAELHRGLPPFQLMMVTDVDGHIVASTKVTGQQVSMLPIPKLSLTDKPYFVETLTTGAPYISDGIEHPYVDAAIAAAIGVPIADSENRVVGVLIGFFDLSDLSRAQNPLTSRNRIQSLLLDRAGRVLFASETSGWQPGDDLSTWAILSTPFPSPGKIFNFTEAFGTSDDDARFLATGYALRNGWQIFLYGPLEELETALLQDYGVAIAWLTGALLVSILLALLMVKSLSGPLETIDSSLGNFDLNLNQKSPSPPADAPREVRSLFANFAALDTRLRSTYRKLLRSVQEGEKARGELIYTIAHREKEIEKRTQELQEANETLKRLSREDSLTGLANRRWFAEFLARAWQGALRDAKPLCILIIDIDDFKAFNDQYGHQKGDDCLKLVAEAIRSGVGRASDLVSRYGGEEFVVILGDTPLEGGLKIAERIRADVERLAIPHEGAKCHPCVTISVGVTSVLPTRDTHPETVLIAADRAMYNAKNDGKNKVSYSTTARTGTFQALCLTNETTSRLS